MIKKIILAAKRLNIRLKMRSATAEIEDAERRIKNDERLIVLLRQHKSDLHADLYYLEKKNFSFKGINA